MANWQSIDELHDISADLPRFTQAFTELATRLGLDIAPLEADHISLRCHQNATAERWRRGFEQCGELLSENIINGRPICLFRLREPRDDLNRCRQLADAGEQNGDDRRAADNPGTVDAGNRHHANIFTVGGVWRRSKETASRLA